MQSVKNAAMARSVPHAIEFLLLRHGKKYDRNNKVGESVSFRSNVVEFGHQEVQNVTVESFSTSNFLCQAVEGLAELAGARSTEPSRYWCKPRQKSGTAQLLITETRSR